MNIILASTSPRRIELMRWLGVNFEAIDPNLNEKSIRANSAELLVKGLAEAKVKSISSNYSKGIIIGADSVVELGKNILEKPTNKRDQRQMINLANGKEMSVVSAISINNLYSNKTVTRVKRTRFKMRKLTQSQIESYISKRTGLDKAGGFGLQDEKGLFAEKIIGCYPNSIGFPICLVSSMLKKDGVIIKNDIKKIVTKKTKYKC